MRTMLMAAAATVALAGSAYAQQAGTQTKGAQAQQPQAMSQEKLRQTLQKAGFEDIRVLDAAYLVEARTQDGTWVTMMVDAPRTQRMSGSMQGGGAAAPEGRSGSSSASDAATSASKPAESSQSKAYSGAGESKARQSDVPRPMQPDNKVPYERK